MNTSASKCKNELCTIHNLQVSINVQTQTFLHITSAFHLDTCRYIFLNVGGWGRKSAIKTKLNKEYEWNSGTLAMQKRCGITFRNHFIKLFSNWQVMSGVRSAETLQQRHLDMNSGKQKGFSTIKSSGWLTWSFSGLSEMSFRLLEVRFRWVVVGLSVRTHQHWTVKPASLYSKNGALSGKYRWQRSKKRQWPRQFAQHAAPKKKERQTVEDRNERSSSPLNSHLSDTGWSAPEDKLLTTQRSIGVWRKTFKFS